MMVYTKNLILVCTGRDTTKAASLGMPVLQLCLGISQSGALQRLKVSAVQRHCLLGVTAGIFTGKAETDRAFAAGESRHFHYRPRRALRPAAQKIRHQ